MPAMPAEFVFLSQEDVVAAGGTDMAAMVDVIERAFRVKAAGEVRMPHKAMITWADEPGTEERDGRIMAMPAYVGGEFDVAGLKWIPSVPDNPRRHGLPRANALVLLTSRQTGLPLAVMDGTVVSAMRTGAVTGVAVRHLADPGTRVACLLGAGVLAHTQLEALRAVLPELREVRVYDPDSDRCRRFCARARSASGLDVRPADASEQAVRGAGVVVPATMAVEPSFAAGCVDPGATVVLVSSLDGPLDLHAVTDVLVVDDWEHESTHPGRYAQRLVEAGIVAADGSDAVELSDIVTGRHPGRTAAGQRIVVTPVGLAMDDVAAAWHVLQGARSRGLGTPLRLRSGPPAWE
jgi:ornithine cyclodeaminase/alanine dehydrogenase-like protein (mu-crystallin family)